MFGTLSLMVAFLLMSNTIQERIVCNIYDINTNEIPSELSRENMISSHANSQFLALRRYHVFARKLTWYFIGVYIINITYNPFLDCIGHQQKRHH